MATGQSTTVPVIENLPTKRPGVIRVRFNGVIYRRYPKCRNRGNRVYFRCSHADALRGFGWLHRDIWAYHNGPIPDGNHVHHKDTSPFNNDLTNLECLTPDEHHAKHEHDASVRAAIAWRHATAGTKQRRKDGAAEWHRSEEGRKWHAEHFRKVWQYADLAAFTCERCGSEFKVKKFGQKPRFCTLKCKAAARRASGVDDADRPCVRCGAMFRVNRYSRIKTCSPACRSAMALRQETRACLHCSATFTTHRCRRKRYCTVQCAYKHRSPK